MAKQPRVATDPELLKPIIEAVIFAGEEPISARSLIRLLAGDRENEPAGDGLPDPAQEPIAFETAESAVADAGVETAVMSVAVDPVATAVEEIEEGAGSHGAPGTGGEDEATANAEVTDAPSQATRPDDGAGMAGDMGGAGEEREPDGEVGQGEEIEGDGIDLADAMERIEDRVNARHLRPRDGSLDQAYLRALIDELNDEYQETGRAFRIVEVAGGFQFATVREYGEFVAMLSKDKARRKLSPAALETLAIIAYRQPVSKPEVEAIRGVNCDQVLLNLMEKNLVAITGRSEAVGRPLLYGTTEDFLRSFGLKGLGDLPKLREIEELMEEDAFSPERAEVITVDEGTDAEEIEARVGAAGHTEDAEADGDGLPIDPEAPMQSIEEDGGDPVDDDVVEEGAIEREEAAGELPEDGALVRQEEGSDAPHEGDAMRESDMLTGQTAPADIEEMVDGGMPEAPQEETEGVTPSGEASEAEGRIEENVSAG